MTCLHPCVPACWLLLLPLPLLLMPDSLGVKSCCWKRPQAPSPTLKAKSAKGLQGVISVMWPWNERCGFTLLLANTCQIVNGVRASLHSSCAHSSKHLRVEAVSFVRVYV